MADKLFIDNDLLQEKSYDTRIAEKVDVQPDADYLEEEGFKKRLTEAIETGSGGGGVDFTLREITFVNTTEYNLGVRNAITENNNTMYIANTSVARNNTTIIKILASKLQTNGYVEQYIELRTLGEANLTISGDYATKLGEFTFAPGTAGTAKIILVAVNKNSPKDITITVS